MVGKSVPCNENLCDGLGECDGSSEAQRDILSLISEVLTFPEITIRFIIASRSEHQITYMFNKEPLKKARLVLDDNCESLSDIMMYLRDGFNEIREREFMIRSQNPWPSDSQLEQLAWRASGQFIYVATVLKFVGSDFCDPKERLDIRILHPGPMQAAAFSELDRLYTRFLSVYPRSGVLEACSGGYDPGRKWPILMHWAGSLVARCMLQSPEAIQRWPVSSKTVWMSTSAKVRQKRLAGCVQQWPYQDR
jgi:hypothetical protein